jgi:hypothetical protein
LDPTFLLLSGQKWIAQNVAQSLLFLEQVLFDLRFEMKSEREITLMGRKNNRIYQNALEISVDSLQLLLFSCC